MHGKYSEPMLDLVIIHWKDSNKLTLIKLEAYEWHITKRAAIDITVRPGKGITPHLESKEHSIH